MNRVGGKTSQLFWLVALLSTAAVSSGQEPSGEEVRLIVQFAEPPILRHWTSQLPAERSARVNGRFLREALASETALSYRAELEEIQLQRLERLQAIVDGLQAGHRYLYAFNGAAVTVDRRLVDVLARQPGVIGVFPSIRLQPEDEYSEQIIEAPTAWTRLAQEFGKGRPGEGARIAIIDSGVIPDHPSFNDAGFTAPPGFPVSEVVRNGTRSSLPAGSTNNKVIVGNVYVSSGASSYTRAVSATHGSQVAATAAGVAVSMNVGGSRTVVQGVAPNAYVLNLMPAGGTPEYVAALDDAARYGADVVNMSLGTTTWLGWIDGRNPIQETLEALAEAGVVVCVSAGNSGNNGPGTISGTFKYSDQVLAVGNHSSGRPLANGKVSAVAPAAADSASDLKNLELVSSYPFRSPLRAPLVPTATITDSQGHVEDDYARKALYPFPAGSLTEKIALVERGAVGGLSAAFASKWANVKAGGAVALIVYNNANPGDPGYNSFGLFITPDPYAVMERAPGLALDQAARAFGDSFEVEIDRSTIIPQPDNALASSSSRGPTDRLRIKPDLSAPGSNILLPAFSGNDFVPNGFALTSGTSFSSPAVAGAAGLLRQAHPDWSPRQIRAALVTTADTQLNFGGAPAGVMIQGSGSLRVDRALKAALHISPYTLSLGTVGAGQSRSVTIQVEDTRPAADTSVRGYLLQVAPRNSGPRVTLQSSALSLAGGQQGYVNLTVAVGDSPVGDYDGHLLLITSDGSSQAVPYFLRVGAAPAADVLLVLWRDDDTTANYRSRYESLLTQAGLSFDVQEIRRSDAMPTLQKLQRYRLVILVTGDEDSGFTSSLQGGSFPWQSYLNAGGRLLITGHAFPTRISFNPDPQNQGADFLLSSYAAGYVPVTFNPLSSSAERVMIRLSGSLGSVDVSSGLGGDGAGNQKGIDLGRLVSAADANGVSNALELVPHIQKLLAASEITVDGTPFFVSRSSDVVATGVWPDSTLERPTAGVSWGAAFLAFGLEGVNSGQGQLSGPELLTKLYRWLVDDLSVRLDASDLAPGRTATLRAVVRSSLADNAATGFRWDFGDGSPIASTQSAVITHEYSGWPSRAPRVEVTDSVGHTVVSPASIYLPFLTTADNWTAQVVVHNTGSQPAVPKFLAFDDAGTDLAARSDRAILPGGRLSMNLAELFPSVSTGLVRHVRIDSAGSLEALAVVTSGDGEEMTTIPGRRWAQPLIFVPHISQAVAQYYTRYALIRTATGSETLSFEGNGGSRPLAASTAADSQDRRSFAELYGGALPAGLEWGKFTNSAGSSILAGVEIFGRVDGPRQLAAMPLDGDSATTLSFVHVSSDSDLFWTGIVYVNVGGTPASVTVKSYAADGTQRTTASHTLGPGEKQVLLYDRSTTTTVPAIPFTFPQDVAWIQVQSMGALIGYEIFGTADESRLEGLTAATAGARRLLFPYLQSGPGLWTGIAVVNLSDAAATATLKALDPAGRVLATVSRSYRAFAKDLGLVQQLFGGTLPAGTAHLVLESDSPLWGFELFGDDAGRSMAGANAIPLN